jgi:hypothetical protein
MLELMTGLGLALLGGLLFYLSEILGRYPAQGELKPPWSYWILRPLSQFLMGLGAVVVVSGFL